MSKIEGLDKELDLWVEVFIEHPCKVMTENGFEMTYDKIGELIDLMKKEVEMFKKLGTNFKLNKIKCYPQNEEGYVPHAIFYKLEKAHNDCLQIYTKDLSKEQIKMLHDTIKSVCSI